MTELTQVAKLTVERIDKDTAMAAADLLRKVEGAVNGNKKETALAASKMLMAAQKTTNELNQRAEKSASQITEQAENPPLRSRIPPISRPKN